MPNSKIMFRSSIIEAYSNKKGDFDLAIQLILSNKLSNKDIAAESKINKDYIPILRRKLRS